MKLHGLAESRITVLRIILGHRIKWLKGTLEMILSLPYLFCQQGDWDSRKISGLPKITHHINVSPWTRAQISQLSASTFSTSATWLRWIKQSASMQSSRHVPYPLKALQTSHWHICSLFNTQSHLIYMEFNNINLLYFYIFIYVFIIFYVVYFIMYL